jgi:catechol 2,3-dioxygenase-like lactoylglutathione lyase family enzyme
MIRIGSIVLRVDDLQRQTEFWEAALGYVRRDSGESDDFVLLGPPDGAPEVWSVYGAERSQPVATGGRWDDLESGSDTRKPLPWVATSCPDPKMVRRVRRFESVRGLQEDPCKRAVRLASLENGCHARALAGTS